MSFLFYSGALYREAVSHEQLEYNKQRFFWRSSKKFRDVITENLDAMNTLAQEAAEATPENVAAQKVYFMQKVQLLPGVSKMIRSLDVGQPHAKQFLLSRIMEVVLDKQDLETVSKKLWNWMDGFYKKKQVQRSKSQLKTRAKLPSEFLRLLPASYALKVGPSGEVVEELSVWGNKVKDEMAKSAAMAKLLNNWNDLVERLNRDITAQDPFVRLCAIISSIILHTGVRPGVEGESFLRDSENRIVRGDDGKPVRVTTFGASGLKDEHLQFIREDFARLEFPGKGDVLNVAVLRDPDLIRALKLHIEQIRRGGGEDVFVLNDSRRVTDRDVNLYLREVLGDYIQASDFRKLQATRVYYSSLRRRKEVLAERLRELKTEVKVQLKKSIIQALRTHIYESLSETQQAMSHEALKTTINSYIDPKVTLIYLTQAGLETALEEIVGDGRGLIVKFDPIDFYNKTIAQVDAPPVQASFREGWTTTDGTTFAPAEPFVNFSINDALRWLAL